MTASEIEQRLGLLPHPEGGFYREIYRSGREIETEAGLRSALTVIYYLLTADSFSGWHRLRSDETWHFTLGSTITIETLHEHDGYRRVVLGPEGPWVAVIPPGVAFAAHVDDPGGYALVSCCVAPGFEFEDFVLLDADELATAFPEQAELAHRFARPRA